MFYQKRIISVFIFFLAVFLAAADYDFSVEKFNAAVAAAEKGGLPVVLVDVNSIEYSLPVEKKLLSNKDFMARADRDFQLFVWNHNEFSAIGKLCRKSKTDAVTVYHGDDFHTGSIYFDMSKEDEYYSEILKLLRPRHAIHKYNGSNGARRAYEDWKAGKLNINEYDRDGRHVFHVFIENIYPGFYIEDDIFIEMIEYLSKQNLPKDFWSYTLLLHTWQLPRYDAEKPSGRYRTLKEWCCITDMLIKAGADPNYADEYGISTAFVYFRYTSHVGTGAKYDAKARFFAPAARKLMEYGMDFNRIYPNKRHPLRSPRYMNNMEVPILPEGEIPWGREWEFYNWEEVLFLIDNLKLDINAQIMSDSGSLFYNVIKKGGANIRLSGKNDRKTTSELIDDLLQRGASAATFGSTGEPILMYICKNIDKKNYEKFFYQLLQAGADVNIFFKNPNSYFLNDKNYTGDSIFTVMPSKYRARRDIVDLLLKHGIKPEYLENSAAINAGNEDLALYILQKGGYTRYGYDDVKRLKKSMPRLAKVIAELPPERVRPTVWDNSIKPKVSIVSAVSEEHDLLRDAVDLLEKYASFYMGENLMFTTGQYKKIFTYDQYAPGCYIVNGLFRSKFTVLDKTVLEDYSRCRNKQEEEAFKVKLALQIIEANLSVYNTCNSLFWDYADVWKSKMFNYGRDCSIIWLKHRECLALVRLFECAAKLYLFMPANRDCALEYFSPATAGFLKARLDALAPGLEPESAEKPLQKIIGELTTAYWTGLAPDGFENMQKEIEKYWSKRTLFMHKQLKYMLASKKPVKFDPENFLKSSSLRNYIEKDVIYNRYYNRTFNGFHSGSLEHKLKFYADNLKGSEESSRNLYELLKFMVKLPTARKLLEKMPGDLVFASGSYRGAAFYRAGTIYQQEDLLRSCKLDKTPSLTAMMITFFVHEMTHAEQDVCGLYNFSAADREECIAANKLTEIHPLLNQYTVMRELAMYPEYKEVAQAEMRVTNLVADTLYNQYQGFWYSKDRWREEFVKLFWTNARGLYKGSNIASQESPLYRAVVHWFNAYYFQTRQFQNTVALKNKTGRKFTEVAKKYSELMQVDLDAEYYLGTDFIKSH